VEKSSGWWRWGGGGERVERELQVGVGGEAVAVCRGFRVNPPL